MREKNVICFLLLMLIAAITLDYRRTPGAEFIKFQNAVSLIEDGTWQLDRFVGNLGVDKARFGGHWFSAKSIGDTLLAVPATAIFHPIVHSENTQYYLVRLFSAIAVGCLGIVLVGTQFGFWAFALVLLGSPIWTAFRYTHSDLPAASLFLLGSYLLFKNKSSFVVGAIWGLGVLIRYPAALFLIPVFIGRKMLWENRWTNVQWLKILCGTGVVLGIGGGINWWYFGAPWKFSTMFFAPEWENFYDQIPTNFGVNPALKPSLSIDILKHLFSWPFGLVWVCPWIFVALKKLSSQKAYLSGVILWGGYYLLLPFEGGSEADRYLTGVLLLAGAGLVNFGAHSLFEKALIAWSLVFNFCLIEYQMLTQKPNVPVLVSKLSSWISYNVSYGLYLVVIAIIFFNLKKNLLPKKTI